MNRYYSGNQLQQAKLIAETEKLIEERKAIRDKRLTDNVKTTLRWFTILFMVGGFIKSDQLQGVLSWIMR